MPINDLVRHRFIHDMLRLPQSAKSKSANGGKWKVLVVDRASMRVISAVCRMFDIMEEGVTLVEPAEITRQPLPQLAGIYLVEPTEASIACITADFETTPQYGGAHVFFTRPCDRALLKTLANSNAARYLRSVQELNCDFLAVQRQALHFDRPALPRLFGPGSGDVAATQEELAGKLATVCITLRQDPIIRFSTGHAVNGALAGLLRDKLDAARRAIPGYPEQDLAAERATVLLCDRTVDVMAPLLHEFTYEAMVCDLLDVRDGKYSMPAPGGGEGTREVLLNEDDDLWLQLRHTHIADTISYILDSFNHFVKENPAARQAVQKAGGASQTSSVASLSAMTDALRALPQFQELLAKYSLHLDLADRAMKEFEFRKLERIASIEQDMACAETAEGKPVKNLISSMAPVLGDATVSTEDKMRLLALYIISQEGLRDQDRRSLIKKAGLSSAQQDTVSNLSYLGVTLSKAPNAPKKKKLVNKRAKKKRRGDDVPFELSRYVPLLQDVVDDLLAGSLSTKMYPYMNTDDQAEAESGNKRTRGKGKGRSLKSEKRSWASKKGGGGGGGGGTAGGGGGGSGAGGAVDGGAGAGGFSGPPLLVFVTGGVTLSEVRAMYDLSKVFKREIIVGADCILTPEMFLDQLGALTGIALGGAAGSGLTDSNSSAASV